MTNFNPLSRLKEYAVYLKPFGSRNSTRESLVSDEASNLPPAKAGSSQKAHSPLEQLPPELLMAILDACDMSALVGLWHCRGRASRILENYLFGTNLGRQKTMHFACTNGDVKLIRDSVARGANPCFTSSQIRTYPRSTPDAASPLRQLVEDEHQQRGFFGKAGTLDLAARKRHLEAFKTLLDLGADFSHMRRFDKNDFARFLVESRYWPFLLAILVSEQAPAILGDKNVPREDRPFRHMHLTSLIQREAPVDLVEAMVDAGWDVNTLRPTCHGAESPLSKAVGQKSMLWGQASDGSIETADMLVRKGAGIHGQVKFCFSGSTSPIDYMRPHHVPIFAAADYMGSAGSTEWMDWCLRNGADINQEAPAKVGDELKVGDQLMRGHVGEHFTTTPLLAYLEAIPKPNGWRGINPDDGFQYFMEHGVKLRLSRHEPPEAVWPWLTKTRFNMDPRIAFSAVDLIMSKFGLTCLLYPRFYGFITYLVRLGAEGYRAMETPASPGSGSGTLPHHSKFQLHDVNDVPEWWDIVKFHLDEVRKVSWVPIAV